MRDHLFLRAETQKRYQRQARFARKGGSGCSGNPKPQMGPWSRVGPNTTPDEHLRKGSYLHLMITAVPALLPYVREFGE